MCNVVAAQTLLDVDEGKAVVGLLIGVADSLGGMTHDETVENLERQNDFDFRDRLLHVGWIKDHDAVQQFPTYGLNLLES